MELPPGGPGDLPALRGGGLGYAAADGAAAAAARALWERFASPEEAAAHVVHEGPSVPMPLLGRAPWRSRGGALAADPEGVQELADHLASRGWAAVADLGLGRELLQGCRREAGLLRPCMRHGLISRPGAEAERGEARRGDELLWLTERGRTGGAPSPGEAESERRDASAWPCLRRAQASLRVLGFRLAKALALGADGHTDGMLACYDADGALYVPHVDSGTGDPRRLTLVLYLNDDWSDGDGGCLEVLDPDLFEWQRLCPRLGALAVFRAGDILHQVKPSHAPRYALTVWILSDGLSAWEPCD